MLQFEEKQALPDTYKIRRKIPVELYFAGDQVFVGRVEDPNAAAVPCGAELRAIDGIPVSRLIDSMKDGISSSGTDNFHRIVAARLPKVVDSSATLSLLYKERSSTATLRTLPGIEVARILPRTMIADGVVAPGIAYLCPQKVPVSETERVVKKHLDSKALIVDLRNYPEFSWAPLLDALGSPQQPFVAHIVPDYAHPGNFRIETYRTAGVRGRTAPRYKGRLIILVDENTQSRGEYYAMALQTFPNALTVGRHTAGTDGDVTKIALPGGCYFQMTALGVSYPDGTRTQRDGVRLQRTFPLKPGECLQDDRMLKQAIELAGSGL